MLNWLRRSSSVDELDLSFLAMDLHSHLIPGIDDGVQQVQEAVDMVRRMESYGFKHVVTTPHIIWDCYRNTPDIIRAGLATVQEACREAGIKTTIDAAAEYFLDEHFTQLLHSGEPLLTLPKNRVLVELPYTTPLLNTSETLFSILEHGYTPVLAHPERYTYFYHEPEVYRRLAAQGCELQLNALSLTGYYGEDVARMGEWLLKENLIVYLGTDAHRMQHLDLLRKIRKSKWLTTYPFQNHTLLS
ncbi:tyrosine-protein phosphatase [Arundinibacter roseus]|uniref:protein-tyrosine-phosphatase n=1 Tax=Arundinibacter roseus TaxID=2070510 RepID=A0A4V2X9D7_9BACT|nr:CpsB/CapC family capsule biosynthesis tyrosine phosphatase [Arundinibacter roseus]TDB63385.1 histidinol phosphatase [Arundinibacter roseus]